MSFSRWPKLIIAGCVFRLLTLVSYAGTPTALDDAYTVDVNQTLTVAAPGVLTNDSDPDGLTLTAQAVIPPVQGSLQLNADGSFTYTAPADFAGAVSFSYSASNGTTVGNANVTVYVGVPFLLHISSTTAGNKLRWQTVAIQEAASQTIYRAPAATGPWTIIQHITDNVTAGFLDTTAVPRTLNYYKMTADAADGTPGPDSNIVSVGPFAVQFPSQTGINTNLGKKAYPLSGFTWECWTKLQSVDSNFLITALDTAPGEDMQLYANDRGDGKVQLNFEVPDYTWNGSNRSAVYSPPEGLELNRWYHFAGVADYPNHILYLLVDGERVAESVWDMTPMDRDMSVAIGKSRGVSWPTLTAVVSDVRIWGVPRTDSQIRATMHGLTGNEPGLVAWYNLTDGQGQIAYDDSGNGNDGVFGFTVAPDTYDPVWTTDVPPAFTVLANPNSVQVSVDNFSTDPTPQTIMLQKSGVGSLTYSITASAPWISATAVSGDLSSGTDTINVAFHVSGLQPGLYSGTITLTTSSPSNGDLVIPVSLRISKLVGYWPLDESTGNIAHDASGNGNDGQLQNSPQWTLGYFNNGLALNGTNQFVSMPSSNAIDPQNGWTLSAWINHSIPGMSQNSLIEKYIETDGNGGYALRLENDVLCCYLLNGQNIDRVAGNTVLQAGQWYHVAGTYDPISQTLTVYVNGAVDGSMTTNITSLPSAASLKIGARGDDSATTLNGIIDEVRIYDGALSLSEIGDLATKRSLAVNDNYVLSSTGTLNIAAPGVLANDTQIGLTMAQLVSFPSQGTLVFNSDGSFSYSSPSDYNGLPVTFTYTITDSLGRSSNIATVTIAPATTVTDVWPAPGAALTQPPAQVIAQFSASLDPNSVSTATVVLVGAGPDGIFGTDDDVQINPVSVTLVTPTEIICDLTGVPVPNDTYHIVLRGNTGPAHGSALLFDGANTIARVPQLLTGTGTTGTVECWAKPTQQGSGNMFLHKAFWNDLNFFWDYDAVAHQGKFGSNYPLDKGGTYQGDDLQLGNWYHFASVYDGSTTKLYVNGVLKSSFAVSGGINWDDSYTGTFIGGFDDPTWGGKFPGVIDEVRVWNVARSQIQILANMNQPLSGPQPGLVGYFKFDEGSGQIIHDSSGFGRDGTLGEDTNVAIDDPTWLPGGGFPGSFIVDVNGNAIDGEPNATFPSGDGNPGGDFITTFTVNTPLTTVTNVTPAPGSTVNSAPLNITATFSAAIDPNTVTAGTVQLFRAGTDGVLDTADDVTVTGANIGVNGNQITFSGVQMPNDKYRLRLNGTYGLHFNGTQWVSLPPEYVQNLAQVTLEAKFKTISPGPIFSYSTNPYPGDAHSWISAIYIGTDGCLRGQIANNLAQPITTPFTVTDGQWHHVAVSAQDDGHQAMYLDGQLIGTIDNQPLQHITLDSNMIGVGSTENWPAGVPGWMFFAGELRDFRIWSLARSQSEILSTQNAVLTGNETGLITYYKFDEGTGQTVHDYSNNGNNGILGADANPGADDPLWVIALKDVNGNVIDGEPNAAFPSGDGQPGGDFTELFTVAEPLPQVTGLTPAPGSILPLSPSSLVATLSKNIDPASVDVSTVTLLSAGPDGIFGTPDDQSIAPSSVAVLNANQIQFNTANGLQNGTYQFRLKGSEVSQTNLAAYYNFNEGAGTIAGDSSGNANNGIISGPLWSPGHTGSGLNFAGGTDQVVVPRSSSLEPANAITVSVWANIRGSIPGDIADIIRKEGPGTGGYVLRWSHSNGVLHWYIVTNTDAVLSVDDTQPNSAYLNAWHHFAATYDSQTGTSCLYVDGVLHNSATVPGFGPIQHTDDLYLMFANYAYQKGIPGVLDDVRIYGRSLSAQEIAALYAGSSVNTIKDTQGNTLDGEPHATFPSGDGITGGDYTAKFSVNAPVTTITNLTPAPGSTLTSPPTNITATFSAPLNAASISAANVVLVRAGPDGVFGTADDIFVTPKTVSLISPTQVQMDLTGVELPNDTYHVVLRGNGAPRGSALLFDGANTIARVPQLLTGSGTEATIECWAKPTQLGSGNMFLHKAFWNDLDFYWEYDPVAHQGKFGSTYPLDKGGTYQGSDLQLGNWYHFASVYDGSSTKLYVNGELKATFGFSGSIDWNGSYTGTFIGGFDDPTWGGKFPGVIDEVRVWQVARTQQQLKDGMYQSLTPQTGLVGYFKFDEGSGQIVHDSSGLGHDGTLGENSAQAIDDPAWLPGGGAPGTAILDLNSNPIDGEPNASFPSGNGIAGGDFIAQFTMAAPLTQITGLTPAPNSTLSAPDSIVATFSAPLDVTSVGSGSVQVIRPGVDGLFGTADDIYISPVSVTLTSPTQITVDLTGVKLPNDTYEVILRGSPWPLGNALLDLNGNGIDGEANAQLPSGNGTAGGDFVTILNIVSPPLQVTGLSFTPGVTLSAPPANVLVTFSEPVDSATVNADTCLLVRAGPDGVLGTADDVQIAPTSVSVVNSNQALIDLTGIILPYDTYQLKLSSGNPSSAPTSGLAAYYKFDEGSGTQVSDQSGNGLTGTLTGGMWTQGVTGSAVEFGPISDIMNISAPDISPPWTATFWVKRHPTPTASSILLAGTETYLKLEQYPNLKTVGFTQLHVSDYSFNYVAPAEQWVHLTFVGNTGSTALYVNGKFQDIVNAPINLPMNALGYPNETPSATLDEIRVYNRALSTPEIASLVYGITDTNGNRLDGEPNPAFPSGDGHAGGDFTAIFKVAQSHTTVSNASFTTNEDTPFSATLTASSLNNNPLTWSIVTQGQQGAAIITDQASHIFSYVPNRDVTGTDTFYVKANDGISDSNIAAITVTILETPSIITSPASDVTIVGQPYTYQITANHHPIGFNAFALPEGLSVDTQTGIILGTPVTAGTFPISLSATNHAGVGTQTLLLVINKGQTNIEWSTSASIPYPTPLSVSQLNASANVPGLFTYSPSIGTVLPPGTYSLYTQFTPADSNYNSGAATTTLTVTSTSQSLTWAVPADIVYGTPITGSQLNASADQPGTFVYNVAPGNILGAGAHTLTVTFTPANANLFPIFSSVTLNVLKATPNVSWSTPAAITVGMPLSVAQLNASASIRGSFAYTPPLGTVLPVGNAQTLSAQFTPADSADYNSPPPLHVTIDVASLPEITRAGSAGTVVMAGQTVRFLMQTPAGGAVSWAWNFGDGTTQNSESGDASHAFSPAGNYTVTVITKNSAGSTLTQTMTITVIPNVTAGKVSETDSDGDGFSDSLEIAMGSNPNDPKSTPLNNAPAPNPIVPAMLKLAVGLNFARAGNDSISLSGMLNMPSSFKADGQKVGIDAAGISTAFILDTHGSSKTLAGQFELHAGNANESAGNVQFRIHMTLKGSYASELSGFGLTNANIKNAAVTLPVTILLNGRLYHMDLSQHYTAAKGKSGISH